MCDEWMPVVRMPMSIDLFHQLPRHPAYKYELLRGYAVLTPRAKFYHARLDLSRFHMADDLESSEPADLQPVRDEDFPALQKLFAGAFAGHQPFASLDEETRKRAAAECLERTRTGGDGPWLRQASFVARASREDSVIGAILLSLLPEGDALDFESYYWRETAPADLLARRGGRAHLTWIFVNPWRVGQGIGTILLERAVQELWHLGYAELYSTFLVGNHASMLWHWRNGFELLSYPFSVRRMRHEIKQKPD